MSYLLFDVLFLGLPVALLLRRAGRPPGRLLVACGALITTALAWTAPWDEYLVRSGVWSYGADRVLVVVGSVPAEEYAFVVLEVLLVAAWGHRLSLFSAVRAPTGSRWLGAAAWLSVLAVGAGLVLAGGSLRYVGLLLVWAAPPLALQRAVAGDLLRARLAARMALVLPIATWLCVADRLALAEGVWQISPASSTGWLLLGLPVEEALFFLLTSLLVADGLVLATDPRAPARVARLLGHLTRLERRTVRPRAFGRPTGLVRESVVTIALAAAWGREWHATSASRTPRAGHLVRAQRARPADDPTGAAEVRHPSQPNEAA